MEGKPKRAPLPPRPPEGRVPRPLVRPPSGAPPNPGLVPPPGMGAALREAASRQRRLDNTPLGEPKKKKNLSVPAGQIEGTKTDTFTDVDGKTMDVIDADN